MRKYITYFWLFIFTLSFIGCEVDDICIENVATPKLIITFYDFSDTGVKKDVLNLYVWAESKDTLYEGITTDSIALPLNTNSDFTKYLLSSDNVVDTLYLYYDRKNIFVSRSCGYKMNFEIRPETYLSSQWIDSLMMEDTPQLINDESKAAIKIFH